MLRQIFLPIGLLVCSFSFSQTTFKANQKVSGVWDKEHSPYIIQDRIYIEKGKQLIIEPGVIVKLNSAYEDAYRSGQSKKNENRGSIVVIGTLIAKGTPSDSIIFAKTGYNPYWGSIYFYGESKSEMSYCIIENSGGIYDLTGPNIDAFGAITTQGNNSEFRKIHIRNSVRGIYCTKRSEPIIDSIKITETKKDAILIKDKSTPVISNFIISKSGNGIFGQYNSPFVIENGLVCNCKYSGVRGDDHSNFSMKNVVVMNTKYGVRFDGSDPEISNSNIIQNRAFALVINKFSKPKIYRSIIWDNTQIFEYYSSIEISHCILQKEICEGGISQTTINQLAENNHFGPPEEAENLKDLLTENPAASVDIMIGAEKITVGVVQ